MQTAGHHAGVRTVNHWVVDGRDVAHQRIQRSPSYQRNRTTLAHDRANRTILASKGRPVKIFRKLVAGSFRQFLRALVVIRKNVPLPQIEATPRSQIELRVVHYWRHSICVYVRLYNGASRKYDGGGRIPVIDGREAKRYLRHTPCRDVTCGELMRSTTAPRTARWRHVLRRPGKGG